MNEKIIYDTITKIFTLKKSVQYLKPEKTTFRLKRERERDRERPRNHGLYSREVGYIKKDITAVSLKPLHLQRTFLCL